MRLAPLLLLLTLTQPIYAQVKVRGEATYQPHKKIVLTASDGVGKDSQFTWDVDGTSDPDLIEQGGTLYVWAAPGTYKVLLTAYWIDGGKIRLERSRFTFKVEGEVPLPPDPKPGPGPGPTPKPTAGLKVLILFDSKLKTTYSDKVLDILSGQEMTDWLKANCSPDSALGNGKGYAAWPASVSADAMPAFWKEAVLRGRPKTVGAKTPYMIVGDGSGTVVWEGPVPDDVPATITLLSRFLPAHGILPLRKAG